MIYPGNSSLPTAVRDRVVSTFRQAVQLLKAGRMDEVSAGCNLILQMDPTFDPAKKLLEKARNPSLPIDVDTLLPEEGGSPMEQARSAMAERDFQRVVHLTTEILTNDLLNDEARILGDQARERMEAAPFVDQFVRKCDDHLAAGRVAAAKTDLEKARALDPTHPEILRLDRSIAAREAAPAAPPVTPSFVVDDAGAAASGRAAAQASDFGFTFEEEKAAEPFANFSFDTPSSGQAQDFGSFSFGAPAAAASPAAGEFDFSTASVTTSEDDQNKIARYLEEGDREFDAGNFPQAIDVWSRIFLIDVTNDQASERIERAKARRREIEGRIEPLLTAGIGAFDAGDTERAHAAFSEILSLDPDNAMAQDYLDRLSETVEGGASARTIDYIPPEPEPKLDLGFLNDESDVGAIGAPAVSPVPAAKAAPAKKAAKAKPAASGRKLPMGAIAALVGVLIVGAGGWFAWTKFGSGGESDSATALSVFNRASALAGSGRFDEAIAMLQDIKPGDPEHDKALEMIADLQQKKASSAALIDGKPAEQYYEQKIAAARAAFDAHDYSAAKLAFEQATRVKPLPPDLKASYDTAAQQVSKLDAARALFKERKYADAITNLQPLLEQDPQNRDIQRLILDAHFNLGAVALQEQRLQDAIREFDQVLAVTPDDELAKRSRALAARYEGEKRDLLYQIYVKYLPMREAS